MVCNAYFAGIPGVVLTQASKPGQIQTWCLSALQLLQLLVLSVCSM